MAAKEAESDGRTLYRIKLDPGPEVLRRGVNLLGVLDEIRDLGDAEILVDPEAVPTLDEIDPERCYLSWTCTLKTDVEAERLGDVFLFIAEDSTVKIETQQPDGTFVAFEQPAMQPPPPAKTAAAASRPAEKAEGAAASLPPAARPRRPTAPPRPNGRHARAQGRRRPVRTPGFGSTPGGSTNWSGSPANSR